MAGTTFQLLCRRKVCCCKRLFFITETITRLPITSDLIVPSSFPIQSNPTISDDNWLRAYDEVDDDNGLVPGVYGVYDNGDVDDEVDDDVDDDDGLVCMMGVFASLV